MHTSTIIARVALAVGFALAVLFGTLSAHAGQDQLLYLPLLTVAGQPSTQPPPSGSVPAELVGTWFSGQLLNLHPYDPNTGVWQDAGGLGHMYVFTANGTYTQVSQLELGAGTTCRSSVSVYRTGAVRTEGGELLLTPNYARTRTVTCGTVASDTEGPYETTRVPWRLGEDQYHHTRLWLTEAQGETEYYKDGLGPQVIGAWANGDGGAIELYDPSSGMWAEPTGENSQWYELNADGTYRRGRAEAGFGSDPCRPITMTYEHGHLSGSGAELTLQPAIVLRHTVSLCDPSDAVDEVLASGDMQRWNWSFNTSGEQLQLMRVSAGFQQVFLVRVG